MGYKTRSNYAPGYSMTEEQFNNIFQRKKDNESENSDEGRDSSSSGNPGTETGENKTEEEN